MAANAWIDVVGDGERAGKALITLLVGDLDERVAQLAARGLAAVTTASAPGLYRKATFNYRAGNTITLGEAPRADG